MEGLNSNFIIQMTEIEVEYTNAKSKMAETVTSYVTSSNCNNPKIISLAPIFSNNLHEENSVFLRGNRGFVYKSKMAVKRRIRGANSKFEIQSESYRPILAIMHFCDSF